MVVKKSIVFDCKEDQEIFEGIISTRANAFKTTQSAELYNLVTKSLPRNRTACSFCKRVYRGENVLLVLKDIFASYAAYVPKEGYNNGKEFVEFLNRFSLSLDYYGSDAKDDKIYFVKAFSYIIEDMKRLHPPKKGETAYTNSVLFATSLYEDANKEPQFFKIINFLSCLLRNWEDIRDNTYTYRALSSLCLILKDQDSVEAIDRVELVELITKLSNGWDE